MERMLVVGAGTMGAQIAMVCALAGHDTTVTDLTDDALARAESSLRSRLDRDVDKGRRTRDDVDAAFARLTFTTDLDGAASTADLVIEAAVEKLDVKREVFARLDKLAPPHAILTTNSSAIMSSQLADATGRPDRVANMHFFNPALVMRCVEVLGTDEATVEAVADLARRLGKEPVVLRKEIPGFVANRILGAVRDEAIFLLENGISSVEDIDTACRTALGYPMGPFELMDLTGIDIGYHAKLARHAVTGDPRDLPSRTVTELVERGDLGRKTGKGFYTYDLPREPVMSTDYYLLDELLTDEAREVRDRVRAFVDSDVLPVINDYWDRAEFPWALVPKLAGLGIVGVDDRGVRLPGPVASRGGDGDASRCRAATAASTPSSACSPAWRWARSTCSAARSRSSAGCPAWPRST